MDLLPALATADVCTSAGSCWPRAVSENLHRAPAEAGAVRIPLRQATHLYARVPEAAHLEMEVATAGVRLTVTALSDGQDERVLFRASEPSAGAWRHVELDLAPWARRVVRLAFHAEPTEEPAGDRWCHVRRLELGSARPTPASRDLERRDPGPRPNVLVYLIDTVRADHVGCYGYGRPTTPRIDGLSASALLFTDTVAQSSWTLPATASILTGLTPGHHGALGEGLAIRPEVPTLAGILRDAGYHSTAFVTNYLASSDFGDARGFDEFHLYEERPGRRRAVYLPSSVLFRRISRWVARRREPFFLYVHATDPHWPYRPPRRYLRPFRTERPEHPSLRRAVDAAWPFFFGNARWGERAAALPDEELAVLRDLYDGELRLADDFFGRLLDLLAQRGVLDTTLVVLTSDHGEEFQEHGGLAHGQTLYEEVLHVPLLVRLPGGAGGGLRIDETVRHVDIVPTVLDVVGIQPPSPLDGKSLLAVRNGAPGDEAYSFLSLMGAEVEAVTGREWKIVHNLGRHKASPEPFEAYDRVHDGAEHHDLVREAPVVVGYGRQRLDALGTQSAPGPAVDPKRLERLRALGYVQD